MRFCQDGASRLSVPSPPIFASEYKLPVPTFELVFMPPSTSFDIEPNPLHQSVSTCCFPSKATCSLSMTSAAARERRTGSTPFKVARATT